MLYLITSDGNFQSWPVRSDLRTTKACECDCCAIECPECPPEKECPHSVHGVGGFCIQYVEQGSLVYQLRREPAGRVLSVDPPIYVVETEFGRAYRVNESDCPADFDLTEWEPIDGTFRCLAYLPKSPKFLWQCLCTSALSCPHKNDAQQMQPILSRPESPRSKDTLKQKKLRDVMLPRQPATLK